MFIIDQSNQDIIDGLESWDWFDFSGKEPITTTCFGDVFFEDDNGIYFLDTIEGSFEKIAETRRELQHLLNTEEGEDHYLMTGLVELARDNGLVLGEGECYDFKVSPSLSGAMDLSNLQIMSFKVSLHISGQLIKQIKDLPPGTKITEIKLADT